MLFWGGTVFLGFLGADCGSCDIKNWFCGVQIAKVPPNRLAMVCLYLKATCAILGHAHELPLGATSSAHGPTTLTMPSHVRFRLLNLN